MATPTGAAHRDRQQRLLDLERKARDLARAAQRAANSGPATGTTADFTSAASAVNTAGKVTGRQAWNTTTDQPVWPVGPAPTDVWVDATGATAHTPA